MDINCRCRWLRGCAAILIAPRFGALPILAVAFSLSFLAASPVSAQPTVDCDALIPTADTDGADDENQSQSDQGQMAFDSENFCVAWTWDDTTFSGGNTGDACALFDTDGDGGVNFAICAQVEDPGSGPQLSTAEGVRFFSCNDATNKPLNCFNAVEVTSFSSDCELTVGADPFAGRVAADCNGTTCANQDLFATCDLDLIDFGGADPSLLNVCSYPSGPPNSNAKDCVVPADTGFIIVRKQAGDDTTTSFDFNITPASGLLSGSNPFTVTGTGTTTAIPVLTATYSVAEGMPLPFDWHLVDASCDDGSSTFDGIDSVDGVVVSNGQTVDCTFTDVNCDDGNACTEDSFDSNTGQCQNLPISCEDGVFCNGLETCDPTLGCQDGPDIICDDGVACTVDSCNETTDSCGYLPNNALCTDGLFCNGIEICDENLGCQAGTAERVNKFETPASCI